MHVGGKVTVSGYDNAWTSPIIDQYDPTAGLWQQASYNLSHGRESATALGFDEALLVVGGWQKLNGKYQGDDAIDLFINPAAAGGGLKSSTLAQTAYGVGGVVINGTAYAVGSHHLYVISAASPVPVRNIALPSSLINVITDSHVPQNGAALNNTLACFYGQPQHLYCLDVILTTWSSVKCSTPHQAGGITSPSAGVIMVAGGFDQNSKIAKPTDVIDIFTAQNI